LNNTKYREYKKQLDKLIRLFFVFFMPSKPTFVILNGVKYLEFFYNIRDPSLSLRMTIGELMSSKAAPESICLVIFVKSIILEPLSK